MHLCPIYKGQVQLQSTRAIARSAHLLTLHAKAQEKTRINFPRASLVKTVWIDEDARVHYLRIPSRRQNKPSQLEVIVNPIHGGKMVVVCRVGLSRRGPGGSQGKNMASKQESYDKLLLMDIEISKLLEDDKLIQVMLLHQYNDIKDAAQIVINQIANIEGTTVNEIHKQLGLND